MGCSSTGYIAGGRAYIVGTLGERVFETFTSMSIGSDEIVDIKIIAKSVLILSKKGEIFQMGEYYKESEKLLSENPKKIDKMSSIKQIYAGFNSFFALS